MQSVPFFSKLLNTKTIIQYVSPKPMMSMLTKNTCHFQFQKIEVYFSWHISILLALLSFLYPALNPCRGSHVGYNPPHSVLISLLTFVLCFNKSNSVAGITSGPCYITVQESQALYSKWSKPIKELLLPCVTQVVEHLNKWFLKGMGMTDSPQVLSSKGRPFIYCLLVQAVSLLFISGAVLFLQVSYMVMMLWLFLCSCSVPFTLAGECACPASTRSSASDPSGCTGQTGPTSWNRTLSTTALSAWQ